MSCACGCVEVVFRKKSPHTGKYCADCGKWLQWVKNPWQTFIWPVGKTHKGKLLSVILAEDPDYLEWAANNMSGTLQRRAKEALANVNEPIEKIRIEEPVPEPAPEAQQTELSLDDDDLPW